MDVTDQIDDPDAVIGADIEFAIDPDDRMWFVGSTGSGRVWLRLNPEYPDSSLYSLWLGRDRWCHLEELPATWSMPPGPYEWPETARPSGSRSFWD